ncbi:Adenine phosphoribosyltransferase [archaeon HR06]|nr:Adenine phosphoribosyltransferase [archaeon HR06]
MKIKEKIRSVPDFPKKGIIFRDLTTLWKDPEAFKYVTEELTNYCKAKGAEVIAGIEARGFIVGSPIAYNLGVGFVPLRKLGKLPYDKIQEKYMLEYGEDGIEIHKDAIKLGQRVVIVDDLLATGGTALASIKLVERLGGIVVGLAFIVELEFLKGRDKLKGYDVFSLVKYKSEEEEEKQ